MYTKLLTQKALKLLQLIYFSVKNPFNTDSEIFIIFQYFSYIFRLKIPFNNTSIHIYPIKYIIL